MDGEASLPAALGALATIPADALAAMLRLFWPQRLAAGDTFVAVGERATTVGFIERGLLEIAYLDAQGNERTQGFCTAGSLVGAYQALLSGAPSDVAITALEPTTLLIASYDDYQRAAAQHPCWSTVAQRVAEQLYAKKVQRERALLLEDAATRYQTFLAAEPALAARLKQHQIAAYLGITAVSLSRIRAQISAEQR